jgi:peptidoglycan LD-endopeptidase LytH
MLAHARPQFVVFVAVLATLAAFLAPIGPAGAAPPPGSPAGAELGAEPGTEPEPPPPNVRERLEQTEEEREALKQEIAEATAELESIRTRIEDNKAEIEAMKQRVKELEVEAELAKLALEGRARTTFIHGGDVPLESLLNADGPTEAMERMEIISTLSRADHNVREAAIASRIELEETRVVLEQRIGELQELEAEAEVRGERLQEQFAEIDEQYEELKEHVARQKEVANGAQNGTYACIFTGAYHFIDSWGFPRSGGRSHKGTDVMAPYRAPVYAFTDGVISRMNNSSLGGISLYLQGDDGNQFFYTHLDGYAPGVHVGMRVNAGDHVAFNGHTGNADPSAPHVHFEVHPGGGSAVNPYPWLREVC